jgi:hypothetical protein
VLDRGLARLLLPAAEAADPVLAASHAEAADLWAELPGEMGERLRSAVPEAAAEPAPPAGEVEVLRLLVAPGTVPPPLDLGDAAGRSLLYLAAIPARGMLLHNVRLDGAWQRETVLAPLPDRLPAMVLDAEIDEAGVLVRLDGQPVALLPPLPVPLAALKVSGATLRFTRTRRAAISAPPMQEVAGLVAAQPDGTLAGLASPALRGAALEALLPDGSATFTPDFAARADSLGRLRFTIPALEAARARRAEGFRLGGAPLFAWPAGRGAITALDGFVLRAALPLAEGALPRLELALDGQALDVAVAVWRDPAAPAGPGPARHLVEADLPGFVWRDRPAGAPLALDLLVDGTPLEPGAILLPRAAALGMLEAAAAADPETPNGQRAALLAIEHLRFGGFLPELSEPAAAFFTALARRLGLEAFLSPGAAAAPELPPPASPREAMETLARWRALAAVNERLGEAEGPIFPQLQAVAEEWGLIPERDLDFFLTLIPALCWQDELPRLRTLFSLRAFHHLEEVEEAWALSIAVAVLACEGQVGRAAKVLYRLAPHMQRGWPNTSCIAFAARHVAGMAALGLAPQAELRDFRYALLGLFDGLAGDWFSRLHDAHMLRTMVELLRTRHSYPDYLQQDVVAAALKHYGLSPVFWAAWEQLRAEGAGGADQLLEVARRHFQAVSAAMADRATLDAALPQVYAALRFFHQHANHEALAAMRETAAHALRAGSAAPPEVRQALLAEIAAADPRDVVRFAALPGDVSEGDFQALGAPPAVLMRRLRELHDVPRSPMHDAQRRAGALLAGGVAGHAYGELGAVAEALAGGDGAFVGADIFGQMALLSRQTPVRRDAAINRFGAALRGWLAEAEGKPFLPAALLAGLARIETLRRGARDPFLLETLARLREGIATRFGTLHDPALACVERPLVRLDPARPAGDVIVAVYSCRAYLDSRVAAIRETWMATLRARGIACIVVVGDGQDRLEGDVLGLACSDLYEDLPEKTLRLVDWVVRHTDARYLIKIDDDCTLHADNYFGSFEYRGEHYYGRRLSRGVGAMDRAWHHAKSRGTKALRLDRSPEPSAYCDGGGVYSLSRFAMTRLVARARSAEGQRLRALSFMEDKLVGDLLALDGIRPANTDYGSYQRRRTFGAAIPVGMWESTFFPSAAVPAKVAHLDRAADQAVAQAVADQPVLRPHRVWPAASPVSLDDHASQLELVSDPAMLAALDAEPFGVVCAVRNERTILPHFLDHYRALGVRAFYMVDNLSDDGSRELLAAQPDVVLYSTPTAYRASHYGVSWQVAVLGQHFLGRWAVVADADEFLIYPHWRPRPLETLIGELSAEGAEAMALAMVDMYPPGGLDAADFAAVPPFEAAPLHDRAPVRPWHFNPGYFSNRRTVVSALRHRLLPESPPDSFTSEKIALFRYAPWVRLSEGLHHATNLRLSRREAAFAHFKYHRGFRAKVLEEVRRAQHFNGAAEYRRYQSLLAESAGGFDAAGVSVRLGEDGYIA